MTIELWRSYCSTLSDLRKENDELIAKFEDDKDKLLEIGDMITIASDHSYDMRHFDESQIRFEYYHQIDQIIERIKMEQSLIKIKGERK